jgi:N-acetylmuramoyl-L-alanine amidase
MSPSAPTTDLATTGIVERPLPYAERLASRELERIELVVLHCTELPDLATARNYGERELYPSGTGNSGHFYIDRDGRIERWVAEDRIAHHVQGHNEASIGIELVNAGRWPDWYDSRRQDAGEPYPDAQIQALIRLIALLQRQLPTVRRVAGHEDLDHGEVPASDNPERRVRRKLDPGPRFPWPLVLADTGLVRQLPNPST